MGVIIGNGVLPYMSIVVGICGENFCTLFADTRLTQIDNASPIGYTDGFHKIMKLNKRVLFGASGLFSQDEFINDALKYCSDINTASWKVVRRSILTYLKENDANLITSRSYMIGYKDRDGSFSIIQIQYDADSKRATEIIYKPSAPQSNYGVACALPDSFNGHNDHVVENLSDIIRICHSHNDLKAKVEVYIHKISPLDVTIGPDVESLTIT